MKTLYLREASGPLIRRDSTWRGAPGGASTEREILLATGGHVRRDGYTEVLKIDPAAIDLSALEGAPLLNSHRTGSLDDVLGVITGARIEAGFLIAKVKFSNRPEVQGTITDINDGIIRGVSVGYSVEQWEVSHDPATGEEIRTAVRWTPREGSIVAIPADPACGFRSADLGTRAAGDAELRAVATAFGLPEGFVTETRAAGLTLEQARAAALARVPTAAPVHNPATVLGPDPHLSFARRLGEAIACRVNPSLRPSDQAREFMGHTSFADDAGAILRNRGHSVLGLTRSALITSAITTGDFGPVLAESLHRTLQPAFTEARSPLWQLVNETTAQDFRDKHSIKLDMRGGFARVGEGGEIKSFMTIKESEEKYRVATYANSFGLSRELLINDNLGALAGIGSQFGQDAARWQDDWLVDHIKGPLGLGGVLSDGGNVFDASRGNLTAFSLPFDDMLTAVKLAFYRMRSPTGKLTPLRAKHWIIPPELELTAQKILSQIQATKVEDINAHAGTLSLIVEPRMQDDQTFYIAAETAKSCGFEYAYLSGAAGPQVESEQAFDSFGVRFRGWFDMGGAWLDWKGWHLVRPTP